MKHRSRKPVLGLFILATLLAACSIYDREDNEACATRWYTDSYGNRRPDIVNKNCVKSRREARQTTPAERARATAERRRIAATKEDEWRRKDAQDIETWGFLKADQWQAVRDIRPFTGKNPAYISVAYEYNENDMFEYYVGDEDPLRCIRNLQKCVPSYKIAIAPAATREPWSQIMALDGVSTCIPYCPVAPGEYRLTALEKKQIRLNFETSYMKFGLRFSNYINGSRNLAIDPRDAVFVLEPGGVYMILAVPEVIRPNQTYIDVNGKELKAEGWYITPSFYLVSSKDHRKIPMAGHGYIQRSEERSKFFKLIN